MHVQIVRFQLKDMSVKEYADITDELAPEFSKVPGLESKIWIADEPTGTYGGAYCWNNRDAMEAFTKTELFESVINHPNLTNITSNDFSVMDSPTKVTRGELLAGTVHFGDSPF